MTESWLQETNFFSFNKRFIEKDLSDWIDHYVNINKKEWS